MVVYLRKYGSRLAATRPKANWKGIAKKFCRGIITLQFNIFDPAASRKDEVISKINKKIEV